MIHSVGDTTTDLTSEATVPNIDPPRSAPPSPALTRADFARSLLWILVVTSALANMAASFGGANTWVSLACGTVTVLCGGTLVVRSLRGRR